MNDKKIYSKNKNYINMDWKNIKPHNERYVTADQKER